jgi:hypothetical protein
MYKNPEIKTTPVLIVDNQFMYKNSWSKKTPVLIVDKIISCTINSCAKSA